MNDRLVQAAFNLALESPGIGKRNSFKVGAVLYKGKTIYAGRYNQRKTHPALRKYSAFPFLHAESSCILSHGMDNCDSLSLLCVRVSTSKRLTMAKPCEACQALFKEVNLKKVYYSDWNGDIQCLF